VEISYFFTYLTFVVLIRLTRAIRIGNAKARSSAESNESKSKTKTLGIGTY
jgi:hypothetical protein